MKKLFHISLHCDCFKMFWSFILSYFQDPYLHLTPSCLQWMFFIIPLIRDIRIFSRCCQSKKTAILLVGNILGYTLRTTICLVIVFTYEFRDYFNFHIGHFQKKWKRKFFKQIGKKVLCKNGQMIYFLGNRAQS